MEILGIAYKVAYVDRLVDVDHDGQEPLLGQVDLLTRSIRIFRGSRQLADIMQTLWHEVIHAICADLHIEANGEELYANERVVDLLATGVNLVLKTNPYMAYGGLYVREAQA